MTVKVSKPAINVREELADLKKPTGIAGEAMLRAETPQEQQALIGVGRRNLIINSAMQVAQRGTSATGTGQYAADRWRTSENSGGTITISQQSDGPYTPDGHFKYYTQINVDSPDTSLGATEYAGLFYKVEGYDLEPAGYGTSNAKTMTLSFWHCHSEAGIYSISMRNDGGGSNRNYVLDYTQDTGGVWQKTIITFEGATDGTWTGTNSAALSIFFTFAQGTGYATSTLNKWFTGTYYHASTNIINMMATTNAKFRITGVQLELGKVATPFEHRSYGEELALCKRYLQKIRTGVEAGFGMYHSYTASSAYAPIQLPVTMRATPTAVITDGNAVRLFTGGTNFNPSTTGLINSSPSSVEVKFNTSGATAGDSGWYRLQTAFTMLVDAEL
jgi:hypothetical protein